MKFSFVLFVFFIVLSTTSFTQEIRKFNAQRTEHSPKIDGELSDRAWKELKPATGFTEFKPVPGRAEKKEDDPMKKYWLKSIGAGSLSEKRRKL